MKYFTVGLYGAVSVVDAYSSNKAAAGHSGAGSPGLPRSTPPGAVEARKSPNMKMVRRRPPGAKTAGGQEQVSGAHEEGH